jgi:DNA polymerase III, delta subunit
MGMTLDEVFRHLPPVLLLLGPGGWEAGERLYAQHEEAISTRVARLDAITARHIRDLAFVKPFGSLYKIFLIHLNESSEQAQNILLKLLEEPPGTARFIMTAGVPPLQTLMSRCQVLVLDADSPAAGGESAGAAEAVKMAVRAARDGETGVLEEALKSWDEAHTAVLRCWAAEAAADRWIDYTPDFAPGVTVRHALTILAALRAYQDARLAAAVALEKAFSA